MNVAVINNISDFVLYNSSFADMIAVKNNREVTSGNHFVWDATVTGNNGPTDLSGNILGGTIYKGLGSGPGGWVMMYEGPINAQWFGAKADGND